MLATTVQLHDIVDVEAFVGATMERSGLCAFLARDEHDELLAEGITILYMLAKIFEPQRAGYAQAGRFSGYAAQFLPRRLGDAWHKSHPEHVRVVDGDGKRHWVYRDTPISLEEYIAPGEENHKGQRAGQESQIRPLSQQASITATSPGARSAPHHPFPT